MPSGNLDQFENQWPQHPLKEQNPELVSHTRTSFDSFTAFPNQRGNRGTKAHDTAASTNETWIHGLEIVNRLPAVVTADRAFRPGRAVFHFHHRMDFPIVDSDKMIPKEMLRVKH